MKAFEITTEQATSVTCALIVDELGVQFSRHIDSMTAAKWSAETPLGADGADLSPAQRAACAERVMRFFGASGDALQSAAAQTIGDWAIAAAAAVRRRQTRFSFAAAGDHQRQFDHDADEIYVDAAAAANLIYGRRRILSLVAPHSLFGFALTILTPNLLQAPALDVRALSPDALTNALAFGDALVATPSLWHYIIEGGVAAPDNAMAVYFGEPMSPELSAEMRKAGFGAQRELYGSTETGLIGWRDSPGEPFVLFEHWKRANDHLERKSTSGETATIAPMDNLIWENDRRFKLAGRRDGAVQIGAVNVFPRRIAEKIEEHPAVKSCVIAVSKHSAGANRLIANIELASAEPPSESMARSIDAWCRAQLRQQERPRVYNFQ